MVWVVPLPRPRGRVNYSASSFSAQSTTNHSPMKTRLFAHQVSDRSYFELPQRPGESAVDRISSRLPNGWELLTVRGVREPLQRRAFAGNCVHFQQPKLVA